MNSDYDLLLKVLIVGDATVGKSCLLKKYTENIYDNTYFSTLGVDFKFKFLDKNTKRIKLQIWDTAGQERFKSITKTYYRGANIVIICFDITNLNSFTNLKKWCEEVKENCPSNVVKIFVGLKKDLDYERTVSFEEAYEFAKENDSKYLEISSKDDTPDFIHAYLIEEVVDLALQKRKEFNMRSYELENNRKSYKNKRNNFDECCVIL